MKNLYIGITAYKNTTHIERCLESIIKQDIYKLFPKVNVNILLGIDGCPETLEYVESFIYHPKYDNVELIYFKENRGTFVTTNSLISMVPDDDPDDDLYLRFDSDDEMYTNMLSVMYRNVPCYSKNSGILMMKKKHFTNIGGFNDLRCGADTLFRQRNNRVMKTKKLPQLYKYNQLPTSLTNSKDMGFGSEYRNKVIKLIEENKKTKETYIEMVTHNDYEIKKNIKKNKIIIGIATMNSRTKSLNEMLKSIENQDVQPDEIIIYNNDDAFFDATDNGKFYYFETELEEDVYFFSMDDDIYYPCNYIRESIKKLNEYNNEIILTYHGRTLLGENLNYYKDHQSYKFTRRHNNEKIIDIPGTGVTSFHTSYFRPITIFKDKRKQMSDCLFAESAFNEDKKILLGRNSFRFKSLHRLNKNSINCYDEQKNNPIEQNKICDYIYKKNNI